MRRSERHDGRVAFTPSPELSAADWLLAGDLPWRQLVCFGPAGFPAYARLRFLPDPAHEGQSENDVDADERTLSESAQIRAALETLARHTSTPDDCYVCLWDGWAPGSTGDDAEPALGQQGGVPARPGVAPAAPPSVALPGPKVVVPHRAYVLLRGSLADVGDWGGAAQTWLGGPGAHTPDPAFVWPADRAWCVAHDVDPHWAGIGADVEAVEGLLADPRLDVVPADPGEEQPWYR